MEATEKKKKILYVITKSNYGGAQRYVFDLALYFKNEYMVAVAFGGTGKPGTEKGKLEVLLRESGIRTIFVKSFVRDTALLSDLKALFELYALFRSERPDIVHLNSSKAGAIGALAAHLSGVKRIIFTSHGLTYREMWRPYWQRLIIQWITWFTILLTHKTVMISKDTEQRAQRMPFLKNKVVRIYNGILKPDFLSRAEARAFLSSLSAKKVGAGSLWIGAIAELHPNKNLDLVLRALPQIKRSHPEAQFVVIGEGEKRNALEAQAKQLGISDSLHLLGFVENAASYLRSFDVFVLPSSKEGLPYVLLEAAHAKLPIVASNIPGNADIIENEQTGLLIELDPAALGTAVCRYLDDTDYAQSHAARLQENVSALFSVSRMAEEMRDLYS